MPEPLLSWSPYRRAAAVPVLFEGQHAPQVFRGLHRAVEPKEFGPGGWTYFRARKGMRLDQIADEAFGRPELWWVVADLNRDVLGANIFEVPAGANLRVPTFEAAQGI